MGYITFRSIANAPPVTDEERRYNEQYDSGRHDCGNPDWDDCTGKSREGGDWS